MSSFLDLDLTNVEADKGAGGGSVMLAEGEHTVAVTEAEVRKNKNNGGQHLWCKFADEDGKYATEMYNIDNPSARATEIGKSQLKAMLEASNHPDPNKPSGVEKIKGIKLKVKIKMGKENDQGTSYPEVKGYVAKAETLDDEIPF